MSDVEVKIYSKEKFTKEDYLKTTKPYEYLYQFIDDKFKLEQLLAEMSESAKEAEVRNFKTIFKKYCDLQKKNKATNYTENITNFQGQEIELNSGEWNADDYGVTKEGQFGEIVACVHPILPTMRMVNIDTGIEKLKIAYQRGRKWRTVICDKKMLASNNSIINLADFGIAVNSESAKHLVTYLHDIESINYDLIPEKNSVSRLGWIDGEGFSPYVDGLVFDGQESFKHFFESVQEKGSREKWMNLAREVRRGDICTRLLLAASFGSVLVGPCGGLPFFIHLWGGTGAGKTVGLMLAASVWANPEMGRYIHTFNATSVGQEESAGFVNSMPLIIDELQIKGEKKDFDKIVYQLSEGVGRVRGQKTGGIQRVLTWNNCILTNGEQPISNSASGGGAVNRIIEINCEGLKLFEDPIEALAIMRKNYGFAGKEFVELLNDESIIQEAKTLQKSIYQEICKGDTTEKQALSASIVLAADALITMYIFKDGADLSYQDLTQFLSTRKEVSSSERAYDFIWEWIAQNRNKFQAADNSDVWGKVEADSVCIIRTIFNKACVDNGFNPGSFLSWLKGQNKIETSEKGYTKSKRVGGIACHCVVLYSRNPLELDENEVKILDF